MNATLSERIGKTIAFLGVLGCLAIVLMPFIAMCIVGTESRRTDVEMSLDEQYQECVKANEPVDEKTQKVKPENHPSAPTEVSNVQQIDR